MCYRTLSTVLPLLLGISRTLNNKLERANHLMHWSILNLGNSVTCDHACLAVASMTSLEQGCIEHSLIVFFQSFRMHGLALTIYLIFFFSHALRVINYNPRGRGLNCLKITVLCIILFLILLPMCGIICLCLLNQLPRSGIFRLLIKNTSTKHANARAVSCSLS